MLATNARRPENEAGLRVHITLVGRGLKSKFGVNPAFFSQERESLKSGRADGPLAYTAMSSCRKMDKFAGLSLNVNVPGSRDAGTLRSLKLVRVVYKPGLVLPSPNLETQF